MIVIRRRSRPILNILVFIGLTISFYPVIHILSLKNYQTNVFKISIDQLSPLWYKTHCFKVDDRETLTVENLARYLKNSELSINKSCRAFADTMNKMFLIRETFISRNEPTHLENVDVQSNSVKIYNRYTQNEIVFKRIRTGKYWFQKKIRSKESKNVQEKNQKEFCQVCNSNSSNSTVVEFPVYSKHKFSYATTDTQQMHRWQTYIMSNNFDRLHLSRGLIVNMFTKACEWFDLVHALQPKYSCPHIVWDSNSLSGTTQIHSHFQGSIGMNSYYATIEQIIESANGYAQLNDGNNYFTDYLRIHQALGLTIPIKNAHIIVHLGSTKDLEFLMIGEKLDEDFYETLYLTIRVFYEDFKIFDFTFGMFWPCLENLASNRSGIPLLGRFVFRNSMENFQSDISGFDLQRNSTISTDRFDLHQKLATAIEKRRKNKYSNSISV